MNDSKRYHALQQQRLALQDEGKKLRGLEEPTDEQVARLSAIPGELDALDAQIQPYEALMERDREGSAATIPIGPNSSIAVRDRSEDDPRRGFANLADFATTVVRRSPAAAARNGTQVDPRLIASARLDGALALADDGVGGIGAAPTGYHQEGHGSSGEGYMVPPEFRQEIWSLVFADDDLLALTKPETTSSNGFDWIADESTPWGTTGIQAYWLAEGAQKISSKASLSPRQFRLHKLAALVLATDELLEDAPRLNSRLTSGAARAIQWKASDAVMWGTGAGQPLGWHHASNPSLISVAKETSQAAATIVPKNILKMYSRMLDMPGSRWLWLANRNIVPELVDLKLGNEPSWTAQNGGLREAPSGVLLGIPIRFTNHASTLGTKGDLQLVDFAGYYAAIKSGGIQFATSIHLYFDYDISAFRWVFRLGGQPFLSAPVTPANGNTTQSQFITLDTRA
jgi:HK97 family phage major capsid protein